ncbi:hypothetical protein D3C80_2113600 [compost metagenome]
MKMVDGSHCAPAHIQGRVDIGLRPFKNLLHLLPIGHLLIGDGFNRRSGDDEPVKLAMLDLFPGLVE